MDEYQFLNLDIAVRTDGSLMGHKKWHKGTPNPGGYMITSSTQNDRNYLVHRLIGIAFVHNPAPEVFKQIDHINHDPRDNRAENLRWVNSPLNNLARVFKNYRKGRWGFNSYVSFNRQRYNLGWYKKAADATQTAHDFKEILFHIGYLQYCKNARKIWQEGYRCYLHGTSANFAGCIERLDHRARGHRNLRKSLLLLPNSYREAPRVLKRFSHLTTKEKHGPRQ